MKNFKVSPLVCQFGSIFGFFRYRRSEYLEVILLILSLRFGADLGRSRLVNSLFYFPKAFSKLFTNFLSSLPHLLSLQLFQCLKLAVVKDFCFQSFLLLLHSSLLVKMNSHLNLDFPKLLLLVHIPANVGSQLIDTSRFKSST